MINGILVVNHYLQSAKFNELYTMIKESAYKNNINLSVKTNREISVDTDFFAVEKIDFVLFWDKDVLLAKYLEEHNIAVFNSSESIRICDDKALTHVALSNKHIRMPRTIVSPFTYDKSINDGDFLNETSHKLGFPMVVKTRFGSFGEGVFLIKNIAELEKITLKYPANSLIYQEYIETSKGKDIRLQVVGDKVVCAMHRYSEHDFRANITNGGKMINYEPSKKEKEMAIKVCQILKLDFAGVDILWDKDKNPILCEVNSNAHFVNIYNCTKVNVADKIFEHIKNSIKDKKHEHLDDI